MSIPRRLALVGTALAGLAFAADASAQGIASITQFKGDVTVVEAASRTPRAVTLVPNTERVANGALANGDEVRTGPRAEASVQFADGSTVRLDASAHIVLSETAAAGPKRPGEKSVRRLIRLVDGRVDCDIAASETVATSVRSAAGLVGVRGTTFTAAFLDGRFRVTVGSGQVFVLDLSGNSVFPLSGGQQLQLQPDGPDALIAQVDADGGRSVSATIGDARVQLDAGDVIRIAAGAGGAIQVTVVAGAVQAVRTAGGLSKTVQAGESFPAQGGEGAAVSAAPAAPRARLAPTDVLPTPPAVPAIGDTVEASPTR